VPAAAALLLGAPIAWAYTVRLADAPVYLHHDEVLVALNAHAIVTTGRDPGGTPWPLYFHVVSNLWQTPISIYATALTFRFLPVTESTIRVPSVIVGLLTIVLMFFVARTLFKSNLLGFIAAALLALTPAEFIHSRLGFDHHYPALFVTAWLLFLLAFLERGRLRALFAAALTLGVGVYSYLASLIMMPVYFLVTCAQLVARRLTSPRVWAAAVAGFALPLVLLAVWMVRHPSQYAQNVQMYNLYDASKLNPLQGLRELLSYTSLTERVSVYYTYFDPSFLLFSGDTSMVHSTRRAGVFLFPFGAFLAAGIYRILARRRSAFEVLLLAGFLLSPLGGTVAAEHYRISRALVMLPFATLIATIGVEHLMRERGALWRAVAVLGLAIVPLQFSQFFRDYMTDYRVRSAGWFEGNKRGVIEEVISREPEGAPQPVYLSSDIGWVAEYWTLYTIKHQRPDLKGAETFDPRHDDVAKLPPGSYLIARTGDDEHPSPIKTGGMQAVRLVQEPNGSTMFAAFQVR
jgi:4-amino-4-deoxy-L-arabinose transferase-like glycosyltransferase